TSLQLQFSLIIDGGSSVNVTNFRLVEKLNLPTLVNPRPYKKQWLSEKGEMVMDKQVSLAITLGNYRDEILCDMGYVVLNRPWAFVQWLEKAEPNHIFVNPLPNLAYGTQPAGFPFFYIKPVQNEKIIRKFYPEEKGTVTDVDLIGNSLIIIQKSLMDEVAPTWVNISLKMKDYPENDKAFGWPPWDLKVENRFIIHYTYGCDYNLKFDMRVTHDEVSNKFSFEHMGQKVVLKPLSPREVCEDHLKIKKRKRRKKRKKESPKG
ncbi:Hydroxyproline O-arabinosyltransferase 3, partial [Mucuna pruriens]